MSDENGARNDYHCRRRFHDYGRGHAAPNRTNLEERELPPADERRGSSNRPDIYFEEMDRVAGPFKKWSDTVALEILRKGKEALQDTLAEMVWGGNVYSVALF